MGSKLEIYAFVGCADVSAKRFGLIFKYTE